MDGLWIGALVGAIAFVVWELFKGSTGTGTSEDLSGNTELIPTDFPTYPDQSGYGDPTAPQEEQPIQEVAAVGQPQPTAPSGYSGAQLDQIFDKYGSQFNVNSDLLRAIAWEESRWNPDALNQGAGYGSFGLMQLLCRGTGDYCSNDLPAFPEWKDQVARVDLYDPDTNVYWGARIIAWNVKRFHGDVDRAIVAYKDWPAALAGPPYSYVRKVSTDAAPGEYLDLVKSFLAAMPWRR